MVIRVSDAPSVFSSESVVLSRSTCPALPCVREGLLSAGGPSGGSPPWRPVALPSSSASPHPSASARWTQIKYNQNVTDPAARSKAPTSSSTTIRPRTGTPRTRSTT